MMNYKVPNSRGPNMIVANPQRMASADGTRWATGRSVKGESSIPGCYIPVEVWTLKNRDASGKVVVVDSGVDRATAKAWVA